MKKKRLKSILAAINEAQDKLHSAQDLITEATGLIETAFLMHDKKLLAEIKKDEMDGKEEGTEHETGL